ncbi:hypothetical protein B0H34DRAFT_677016 [Crassisporium funariophilum]|nr:hypothetical protein B0H34DRAFT_677016 [Crassisporium funariophilum]
MGWSDYKISLFILHCVAILATCFRLVYRMRRRQLRWDDLWAFIAMFTSIFVLSIFMILPVTVLKYHPMRVRSFASWAPLFMHPTGIWSSRMSIAVTIVRLLPNGQMKQISKVAPWSFVLFWLTVVVQKIFICGKDVPLVPQCNIPRLTAALELTTDMLADLWLILWPAYMLMKIRLPKNHFRLLLACFSCGILTTGVNIAHSIFIILKKNSLIGVTAHYQLAISLLLCNILVLVTYIYRVFRAANSPLTSGESSDETPRPGTFFSSYSISPLSRLGSTFNRPSRPTSPRESESRSSRKGSMSILPTTYGSLFDESFASSHLSSKPPLKA